MRVSIYTLGCKTNLYESGQIANYCTQLGHQVIMHLCEADVYIINTCAITSLAEKKSRQAINRARRYNANCRIIVVGCASQKNSSQFLGLNNVTVVQGIANKSSVANLIDASNFNVSAIPTTYDKEIHSTPQRVRAFIKIQDGCNNYCNYCIVPYLRGASRSRTISDIMEEVYDTTADEIVLIGIDISQYGKDIGSSLVELLHAFKGVKARVRLGSFEVGVVNEQFVDVLKQINVCPHFHLSLQSGSDGVLKDMNRHYTASQYKQAVDLLNSNLSDVAITTDIIVGYPTETEQQFVETLQFVSSVGFADIHVFPFSPREGTVASKLVDIDGVIKNSRVDRLTEVKLQLRSSYLANQIGKKLVVLVEHKKKNMYAGYSSNYCLTYIASSSDISHSIVEVKIVGTYMDGLLGEIVS